MAPPLQFPKLLAALALGGVVAILGFMLRAGGALGEPLLRASYDNLHLLSGPVRIDRSPVAIVYLDLASYLRERQDPAKPWPRNLHAKLTDRLTKAGVAAIVFDVIFSDRSENAEADREFAQAIRNSGRVILAAELGRSTHDTEAATVGRTSTVVLPYAPFREAAAGYGIAHLHLDDDFASRRRFDGVSGGMSLAHAAAQFARAPLAAGEPGWIRYYGPPFAIPNVSYSAALDSSSVPDEFFRGKIVFVGGRPMAGFVQDRRDLFRNPFHTGPDDGTFMAGVEVHATQTLNLLRNERLEQLPTAGESLILIAMAVVCAGFIYLRPVSIGFVALTLMVATVWFTQWAFSEKYVWFPWMLVAAQIPAGATVAVLGHSVDWYRTRRKLEASRREAEAKIREQAALIDKANDAILVEDARGLPVYINPGAELLYGWNLNEMKDASVRQCIAAPEPEKPAAAREAAVKNGDWTGQLRQQTRGGRQIVVSSRCTLLRDESGAPKGFLFMNTDLTDQKEMENQLLRAQRMETIGALASGMAHDLNNALSPVLMGVQLLRRNTKPDPEAERLLTAIESNTRRGAEMVRQVLLFARGKENEFQRADAGALVREMDKIARETFPRGILAQAFVADDLWPVFANPTQLHQALLNLCVNARDAMPEGGQLSIAADNLTLGPEETRRFENLAPGDYVSILVSDTGAGIPAELKLRLFEPFFTTKEKGKGTGLGLATVRRIVKNHRGGLRFESEPGKGTTFEMVLPRHVEQAASGPAPLGRKVALVIDDEQSLREMIAEALRASGFEARLASGVAEASQLLRAGLAGCHVVLVDLELPGSNEFIKTLRQMVRKTRVIGLSPPGARQPTGEGGVILRKPFTAEDLLNALNTEEVE